MATTLDTGVLYKLIHMLTEEVAPVVEEVTMATRILIIEELPQLSILPNPNPPPPIIIHTHHPR